MCDERNEHHEREDKSENEKSQDQDARAEPSETQALQPVDDGIEHIGQRHSGHKGQEDLTQNVERKRDANERREPEPDLSLDRHALACCSDLPAQMEMHVTGSGTS